MSATIEDASLWTANANDVIQLGLISAASTFADDELDIEISSTFHPTFTYPIFGENETIYGYKDLKIKLSFKSDDLSPLLNVKYRAKLQGVENGSSSESTKELESVDVEDEEEDQNRDENDHKSQVDDVLKILKKNLPEDTSTDTKSFIRKIKSTSEVPFMPPGRCVSQYSSSSKSYEVFCASLSDSKCKQLFANIQILVLFLVEAGSLIDIHDEEWSTNRWNVYFLYEKSDLKGYSLVGYCTAFDYYWFSLVDPDDCRSRISQFIILPPFQNAGHGKALYAIIVSDLLSSERVREITVEDPSEIFEEMRDRSDLRRLIGNETFNDSTLEVVQLEPRDYDNYIEKTRKLSKTPKRQFARLLEMYLLSLIDQNKRSSSDVAAKYITHVKRRLYRHNKDILSQLDDKDRIQKLEETYMSVIQDYVTLTQGITNSSEKTLKRTSSSKTFRDACNDEEESEVDGDTQMSHSPVRKRVRR